MWIQCLYWASRYVFSSAFLSVQSRCVHLGLFQSSHAYMWIFSVLCGDPLLSLRKARFVLSVQAFVLLDFILEMASFPCYSTWTALVCGDFQNLDRGLAHQVHIFASICMSRKKLDSRIFLSFVCLMNSVKFNVSSFGFIIYQANFLTEFLCSISKGLICIHARIA